MNDGLTALIPNSPFFSRVALRRIDWSAGSNRGTKDHQQIEADDDLRAVMAWLATVQNSPATFANYRKEAFRLLLWCANVAGKPLSSLRQEDFLRYREFLRRPSAEYISTVSFPIGHPNWRPFRGPLAEISVRQAFSTIHGLCSYLEDAGYLRSNPVRLVTKRGWRVPKKPRKPLSDDALAAIDLYLASMPEGTKKTRARWVFALLYRSGLRLSEVIRAGMGDFVKESVPVRQKDGSIRVEEQWFIHVEGKGRKERDVVVPPLLMEELRNYRAFYGLPELPMPGEDRPIVLRLHTAKQEKGLCRSALHTALKSVLKEADAWLKGQGHPLAGRLGAFHAHLFRHTAATHWLANDATMADVRDNLGHNDFRTLSIYVNPERRARFQAISRAQAKKNDG